MCGYISEDGEEITLCIYEEAMPFSEGLASARLDGKYGFIGKDGETVLPFSHYDSADYFDSAGKTKFWDSQGNLGAKYDYADIYDPLLMN